MARINDCNPGSLGRICPSRNFGAFPTQKQIWPRMNVLALYEKWLFDLPPPSPWQKWQWANVHVNNLTSRAAFNFCETLRQISLTKHFCSKKMGLRGERCVNINVLSSYHIFEFCFKWSYLNCGATFRKCFWTLMMVPLVPIRIGWVKFYTKF